MKYRKLRIAWSVACGVLCLLLVALCVRSYWRHDFYEWHWNDRDYSVWSNRGEMNLQRTAVFTVPFDTHGGSQPARPREQIATPPHHHLLVVHWSIYADGWSAGTRIPGPLIISVALTLMPWATKYMRFSVRTLLIGMTVVAMLMWLVIWATT